MKQPPADRATLDEKRRLLATRLRRMQARAEGLEPLSDGERALWLVHQLAPEDGAYNEPFLWRFRGPVEAGRLRHAWERLIERHAVLRSSYDEVDGEPVRRAKSAVEISLEVVVTQGTEALAPELERRSWLPFDLRRGPLLRLSLFEGPRPLLLAVFHHIIIDMVSATVLADELARCYGQGSPGALAAPETGADYADFVTWQRQRLTEQASETPKAFWRQRLARAPEVLELPTDHPRPTRLDSRGAACNRVLETTGLERLKALAATARATPFAALLAIHTILLQRLSQQDDLVVGTPMLGRGRARFERTVGYLVNPVALRFDLADDPPFATLLHRVRRTVAEAFEHQDYPLSRILEDLRLPRREDQTPLFQTFCAWQAPRAMMDDGAAEGALGLVLDPLRIPPAAVKFDLMLLLFALEGRLVASFQYRRALFDATTVERWSGHFETLMRGAVARPEWPVSRLSMLSPAQCHQLLVEWNDTLPIGTEEACLHRLVETQAARTSAAVAVQMEGQDALTYHRLERRANRLAHHLRRLGVGPETVVAVALERSPDFVVAVRTQKAKFARNRFAAEFHLFSCGDRMKQDRAIVGLKFLQKQCFLLAVQLLIEFQVTNRHNLRRC